MADCRYVLGTKVSLVQIPDVLTAMESWIAERLRPESARYVVTTNVYGVMNAQNDAIHRRAINDADLAVPDGMPLVWLTRWLGARQMQRRVYGPDLFFAACEVAQRKGWRHFFYGGAPGVAEKMAEVLRNRFPGLQVAGIESPPFRKLTAEEDAAMCERVNVAAPDVMWIGLGGPKQDLWMAEHAPRLRVPVLVGVGAAFDFFAGQVSQAPRWMREHGLEWFYRLVVEPRRLWYRYLVYNPWFVLCLLLEVTGLKRFPRD
ncbi:MAG: WecB/TagA/CpsF family glycosyltransferase [Verrucomicrobia bacterium]|nr:WecB/TagA/CpsF family glycosyltransferase [Verrucomicrobiota bacterium]